MKKTHYFLQGLFFLIFAQLLVGISIVFSKELVALIPIFDLLAVRFILAAIMLMPLHWAGFAKRLPLKAYFSQLKTRDYGFLLAQALSAGVLFNCLMLLGLHYTDANVAGIITSALPTIIALMSWLFLGEKIAGKELLAIFFATLGLLIIALDKFNSSLGSNSFLGDFIVLLALIPEATYYVLCKIHPNRLPIFLVAAAVNLINGLVILPFVPFQGHFPSLSLKSWLMLFIFSLNSGLFYVFWYLGSRRVAGSLASLATAVMPVSTVIFAWLFLHERLSAWESLGMVCVLVSIFICARR